MARRTRSDGPGRGVRISTVGVVWLTGLGAGFYALLGAAAKYGCADTDHGLACHTSGSLLGVLLVLLVVAVVTLVTLLTYGRSSREVLVLGVSGLVALVICFVAAEMLLSTA